MGNPLIGGVTNIWAKSYQLVTFGEWVFKGYGFVWMSEKVEKFN
jgi:hypothetical protein